MSKITFRADDELVARLEEFDASKSEVMRDALREYLDTAGASEEPEPMAVPDAADEQPSPTTERSALDAALASRVDELVDERLDALLTQRLDQLLDRRLAARQPATPPAQDINLSIDLQGGRVDDASASRRDGPTRAPSDTALSAESEASEADCTQCGETLSDDHVYCPNCGEKRAHRVFCDCGDEVRSDWAFCPSCGRRTPAADVLDRP
jgi:Arc/MetJ-type ribon-helix-helix transcriptional regulator/predicted RNA-binding Zn-ribbon protein involved in translation (DUF1610 family)